VHLPFALDLQDKLQLLEVKGQLLEVVEDNLMDVGKSSRQQVY